MAKDCHPFRPRGSGQALKRAKEPRSDLTPTVQFLHVLAFLKSLV
jgi:hypothetical protein